MGWWEGASYIGLVEKDGQIKYKQFVGTNVGISVPQKRRNWRRYQSRFTTEPITEHSVGLFFFSLHLCMFSTSSLHLPFLLTDSYYLSQPDTDLPSPAEASTAGIDYEAVTLMRMRQAERERLEREILEQEANE